MTYKQMTCPMCGAWVEVLSTRTTSDAKRRRYQCANEHRFTTLETIELQSVTQTTKARERVLQSKSIL